MKVNIKKLHEDAIIPKYAKLGDAGMDITAISKTVEENGIVSYGTGLAFEIPDGYVGLLFPRSSIYRTNMLLTNHVGVLDSGYKNEVLFKFRQDSNSEALSYKVGERIGQIIIIPYPFIEFNEVEELNMSNDRGGGYGSTGV